MNNISLKLDVRSGEILLENGFQRGVFEEINGKLKVQKRFKINGLLYFIKGMFFNVDGKETFLSCIKNSSTSNTKTLQKGFDGDYTIIIWDVKLKKLEIISDRNGSRSVYYAIEEGTIAIADNIYDMPGLINSPSISSFSLYVQLLSYYELDPFSPLENVKGTCPGEILTFNGSTTKIQKFYNTINFKSDYYKTENESVSALKNSFSRVFKKRVGKDRNSIIRLSGGIDSICMLANLKSFIDQPSTVTFSLTGQKETEHSPASYAAKYFGSKHHELIIDPQDLGHLFLQIINEKGGKPNMSAMLALAIKNYTRSESYGDLFTGEDSRLHTPDFDLPIEYSLGVYRSQSSGLRNFVASMSKMVNLWPFYPKGYFQHWNKHMKKYPGFMNYFFEGLSKITPPNGYDYEASEFYSKLIEYAPKVKATDSIQDLFKKHVSFSYRLQHTDNMLDVARTVNDDNQVHFPYFDWECVKVFNKIPYHISAKPILTVNSGTKFLTVRKRVLRKAIQELVPKELIDRKKATASGLSTLVDTAFEKMISMIICKWENELLSSLEPSVRELAKNYIGHYQKQKSISDLNQKSIYAIITICFMMIMDQICKSDLLSVQTKLKEIHEIAYNG